MKIKENFKRCIGQLIFNSICVMFIISCTEPKKNNTVGLVLDQSNRVNFLEDNTAMDSADSSYILKEDEKCYTFTDLSYTYNYKITTTELTNDSTESQTKRIALIIYNKTSNFPVDSLRILSDELLLEVLKDSNSVRSYITNKNTSFEIEDNHYGDVVIEDFNFDSLEDIAVINESGSYSGSRYLFFIQSKKGKFIIDTFLSTKVQFYPSKIIRNKRKLITDAVTGSCTISSWTYQYNSKTSKWKLLNTKKINICE